MEKDLDLNQEIRNMRLEEAQKVKNMSEEECQNYFADQYDNAVELAQSLGIKLTSFKGGLESDE